MEVNEGGNVAVLFADVVEKTTGADKILRFFDRRHMVRKLQKQLWWNAG